MAARKPAAAARSGAGSSRAGTRRKAAPAKPKVVAPAHLPADVAAVWVELVTAYGPDASRFVGPELDAYCTTVARLRDATRRISDEGIVIADGRAQPVRHPALEIERAATADLRAFGDKFRPRPGRNVKPDG